MSLKLMERSIEWILEEEAKGSSVSRRLGVTLNDLATYRRVGVTIHDLQEVQELEARAILAHVWQLEKFEELPSGIDYLVFDSSIVCGIETAQRWLRTALCASIQSAGSGDAFEGVGRCGSVGRWLTQFTQLVKRTELEEVIRRIVLFRRRRHRVEPHWGVQFQQKTNRVNRVQLRAKQTLEVE